MTQPAPSAAATTELLSTPQQVGAHPQTITDKAGLARLRALRTGDHKWLADILRVYLDRYASSSVGISGVGGYAIAAKIFEDANYIAAAKRSLAAMGSGPEDRDLAQSQYLRNLAEAYDFLYDDLSAAERSQARSWLTNAAADMAAAINSQIWWSSDFTNNHNWVNVGALGLAGYAVHGEDSRADTWIQLALSNQLKDEIVGNAVTDGSWHEGMGYQDFMLFSQLPFYLAARTQGTEIGDTQMLRHYGRYALYAMIPGHARQQAVPIGDSNWSRPGHAAILSYVAARYRDPLAQTAAALWEQDKNPVTQRRSSFEFVEYPALQYVSYDATVPTIDLNALPKDYYASDQQTAFLRTGFGADDLALGFKNGVLGGRGLFDLYKAGQGASGYINFGHDHMDDLSLFLSGRSGWYLPEAVSYNCCTRTDSDYTTLWHNSLLFDGRGQLGDNRNSTGQDASSQAPWFFTREAAMPLHASTANYAFARGNGTHLYPPSLGISSLLRTTVLSREASYVILQDRAVMSSAHRVDQVFHAQQSITTGAPGWLLCSNEDDRLLGIRIVAPASFEVNVGTLTSTNSYSFDRDEIYAYARVHAKNNASSTDLLSVLWPTSSSGWGEGGRPDIQPLDTSHPEAGIRVPLSGPLSGSSERWIFGTGTTTSAGGLTLSGATVGGERVDSGGGIHRLVLEGKGSLADASHILLATPTYGVVEVSLSGTSAEVSGTLSDGIKFHGPGIATVTYNGQPVQFSHDGAGTITVGETISSPTVEVTTPAPGSTVTGTISLIATASSQGGIAGVQFLIDGRPIDAEDTSAPYSLSFDTARLVNGPHAIAARARGASGSTATSAPIVVMSANSGKECLQSSIGQPWAFTGFPSQNGWFTAIVEMAASDASTVGGIGLGRDAGTSWTDLAAIVTFSDDGTITARDGGHYVSSGLSWVSGQSYRVRLVVNIPTHTYEAYVRAPGVFTETQIGGTLAFRTEQQTLSVIDTMTVPAGIGAVRACNFSIPDSSIECLMSSAGQKWQSRHFQGHSGQFTATVQAAPLSSSTVGGVGFGHNSASVWTDLAAIVTFSDDGTIVARDGDHYVSSGMAWSVDQVYAVRLVINVVTHTYEAYVRVSTTATETRIGGTLAFRSEQQAVTVIDTMTVAAGRGSVRACGLRTSMP